jgi:hypothetical protein
VSYRRGRRLKYVVRDMFRRRGCFVVRAAASKPVDLVCLRGGEVVLVECKYCVRGVRWAELAPLLEVAEIAKTKSCYIEKDRVELLDRRVPVGSKEIGERVQYGIDDVHHDRRPKKA